MEVLREDFTKLGSDTKLIKETTAALQQSNETYFWYGLFYI